MDKLFKFAISNIFNEKNIIEMIGELNSKNQILKGIYSKIEKSIDSLNKTEKILDDLKYDKKSTEKDKTKIVEQIKLKIKNSNKLINEFNKKIDSEEINRLINTFNEKINNLAKVNKSIINKLNSSNIQFGFLKQYMNSKNTIVNAMNNKLELISNIFSGDFSPFNSSKRNTNIYYEKDILKYEKIPTITFSNGNTELITTNDDNFEINVENIENINNFFEKYNIKINELLTQNYEKCYNDLITEKQILSIFNNTIYKGISNDIKEDLTSINNNFNEIVESLKTNHEKYNIKQNKNKFIDMLILLNNNIEYNINLQDLEFPFIQNISSCKKFGENLNKTIIEKKESNYLRNINIYDYLIQPIHFELLLNIFNKIHNFKFSKSMNKIKLYTIIGLIFYHMIDRIYIEMKKLRDENIYIQFFDSSLNNKNLNKVLINKYNKIKKINKYYVSNSDELNIFYSEIQSDIESSSNIYNNYNINKRDIDKVELKTKIIKEDEYKILQVEDEYICLQNNETRQIIYIHNINNLFNKNVLLNNIFISINKFLSILITDEMIEGNDYLLINLMKNIYEILFEKYQRNKDIVYTEHESIEILKKKN